MTEGFTYQIGQQKIESVPSGLEEGSETWQRQVTLYNPDRQRQKRDALFSETENFLVLDIGEIASKPRDSSIKDKKILYKIYSFQGISSVKRPCFFCEEKGKKDCICDSHLATLLWDFKKLVEERKDNLFLELRPNLERDFRLRVSTNYRTAGYSIPVTRDTLTRYHLEGCFVPPEDILIDATGNVSASKPKKEGIGQIIKSIFRFKGAPEKTFIYPKGDLGDLSTIISEADLEGKESSDSEVESETESGSNSETGNVTQGEEAEETLLAFGGNNLNVSGIAELPTNIDKPKRRASIIDSTPFTKHHPVPSAYTASFIEKIIGTPESNNQTVIEKLPSSDSDTEEEDTTVHNSHSKSPTAVSKPLPIPQNPNQTTHP